MSDLVALDVVVASVGALRELILSPKQTGLEGKRNEHSPETYASQSAGGD